ncbi:MAG: type II toxin-antitoxin system VapB family antitoxin [Acidobacteria bacterium]|nr:type II toxin-antitoxin system VapB family antitoxin [Acidobacteriota bacterium]
MRYHLERVRHERSGRSMADELDDIGRRCARLPVRDPRPPDEILGYDEDGHPADGHRHVGVPRGGPI